MTNTPATAAIRGMRELLTAPSGERAAVGGGGGGGGLDSTFRGDGGGGLDSTLGSSGGAATAGVGAACSGAPPKRYPHFGQNLAAPAQALSHCGHFWPPANISAGAGLVASGLPQLRQNLAPVEFSAPHLAQAITASPFVCCSYKRSAGILPGLAILATHRSTSPPTDKPACVQHRLNCDWRIATQGVEIGCG
jgi:hypothetical protein